MTNASSAFGQLGARPVGVADTVDFLTVTAVLLVAGASSIDHGLAYSAALVWHVVVVELLSCNSANGNEADEDKAVLVLHGCSQRCDVSVKLLGVTVDA